MYENLVIKILKETYILVQLLYLSKLFLNFLFMGFKDTLSLKPDRFNEKCFLRWQEQLEAWLISLGLISGLGKMLPFKSVSLESGSTSKSSEAIDYHCRFRILSCLSDELYETYTKYQTSKELWQVLEETYTRDN